jgi:hypothetical protein
MPAGAWKKPGAPGPPAFQTESNWVLSEMHRSIVVDPHMLLAKVASVLSPLTAVAPQISPIPPEIPSIPPKFPPVLPSLPPAASFPKILPISPDLSSVFPQVSAIEPNIPSVQTSVHPVIPVVLPALDPRARVLPVSGRLGRCRGNRRGDQHREHCQACVSHIISL